MKNILKNLFKKKDDVEQSVAPISTTPSNDPKKKSNFFDIFWFLKANVSVLTQ